MDYIAFSFLVLENEGKRKTDKWFLHRMDMLKDNLKCNKQKK